MDGATEVPESICFPEEEKKKNYPCHVTGPGKPNGYTTSDCPECSRRGVSAKALRYVLHLKSGAAATTAAAVKTKQEEEQEQDHLCVKSIAKKMVTIAQSLSSTIKLNDGRLMPQFGLGMYQSSSGRDGPAEKAVVYALQNGYKMIDTATFYGNQKDVGEGLKKSGVKREDVFVVTKLWANGYESCRDEFTITLKQLDCGYIDLYLIHSPGNGPVLESYKAMMELQQQGLIRSIGVSNFGVQHLEGMKKAGVPTPTVNQIELHPWMKRPDIVSYCRENDIAVMGYSPLVKAERLKDPTIVSMANTVNKTVGQNLIRYSVQMGYITIPKTSKPERIIENAQVFDWAIPEEQMARLNALPENSCTGAWNPAVSPWNG